jgi:hypothetical protein
VCYAAGVEPCAETVSDSLGRRRQPGQSRGLRPLYPKLEPGHQSASVRIAMSRQAWAALERVVRSSKALTRPRAIGHVLEGVLNPSDWQEWQIRKEKQLLEIAS